MSDPRVFDTYSRYYDLLYRDKDYSAEAAYVDNLLKKYGVSGTELLEFGCGTGKHAWLLVERGYRIVGIEQSAEMVACAQIIDGFSCMHGDIRAVSLGRTFDAVISLFHVLSYQTANPDVQSVFSCAAEHLRPGGLFLFDFWYSPAVYAQKPEVRIKRLADAEVEITRIAEPVLYPNENRIDVNYTIHARNRVDQCCAVITETHPMRHFSLPELKMIAGHAGFECLTAEEFLSGNLPGEDTWGVCLVLRKS